MEGSRIGWAVSKTVIRKYARVYGYASECEKAAFMD